MANIHNDASNYYFSGQGVVLIASKNATTGLPGPFVALGNCSSLKISPATTVLDHKGSQDGQRAIDARIITEVKNNVEVTIENWSSSNLALALRGTVTTVPAGTVVSEAVTGYCGGVTALAHINVSSVVLTQTLGAQVLTQYTTAGTAYDYQVDLDAGSFQLNNPTVTGVPVATLGAVPTAVTVGATTVFTVPNGLLFNVGDIVYCYGFTGANASTLNNLSFAVTATSSTSVTLNVLTTAMTITTAAGSRLFDVTSPPSTVPCTVAYTYGAQYQMDSYNAAQANVQLRFEGLNTAAASAAGTFDPVVVDVFSFNTEPLKELSLISDTFGQFVLQGIALADPTQPLGQSKFFRIRKLKS